MTETLVIRFSDPADERVESFLIDGQGQRLGTPTVQNLADCAEMAEGRRVIALLPGESVTLLDAHIPTRKYQRMLQAAPWVLEDQLAQNVERLHFAIGPRQEDDRVRVAVAAHECMQALTERCQKAGLLLAGILPDFLALPRNENEWTLLIDGERVLLRSADCDGFSIDRSLTLELMDSLLPAEDEESLGLDDGDVDEGQSAPEKLVLLRPEQDQAFAEALESRFGDRLAIDDRPSGERPLDGLVPVAPSRLPIDLAQAEYKMQREQDQWWYPWRPVVGVAAAWVLVMAISEGLHIHQVANEVQALDEQVESVFREALPDAERFVQPRLRMEQRLNALRGGGVEGDFLPTLAAMGEGMSELQNGSLRGLSYRPGVLDINIRVSEASALDAFRDAIAASDRYEATIQSANTRDDHVDGRLQVRLRGN